MTPEIANDHPQQHPDLFNYLASLLDLLPNHRYTHAAIAALSVLTLLANTLGSVGEVQASPNLEGVSNPDCPSLTSESSSPTPILECSVQSTLDGPVVQFDVPIMNGLKITTIYPSPTSSRVIIDASNTSGVYPLEAFFTDLLHPQPVIGGDAAGHILINQGRFLVVIKGHDVWINPIEGQLVLEVGDCNGVKCINLPDGSQISFDYLYSQMAKFAGIPIEQIHAESVTADLTDEMIAHFPLHTDVTMTPSLTYTPSTTDLPTQAVSRETIVALETPVVPVTAVTLNFGGLGNPDEKFYVTHRNPNANNSIPLTSELAAALANTQGITNPQELVALAEQVTEQSGSVWNEFWANFWDRWIPQKHHIFLTEKVAASELGSIRIRAAQIDDHQIVHIVGTDANGDWISFNLRATTLDKLFRDNPASLSALGSDGVNNPFAVDILQLMLSETTFVNRTVDVFPPSLVPAVNQSTSWAEANRAAQIIGSVPGYLTDSTMAIDYALGTVSIPVNLDVNPIGWTTISGEIWVYAIVTEPDPGDSIRQAANRLDTSTYQRYYILLPLTYFAEDSEHPPK